MTIDHRATYHSALALAVFALATSSVAAQAPAAAGSPAEAPTAAPVAPAIAAAPAGAAGEPGDRDEPGGPGDAAAVTSVAPADIATPAFELLPVTAAADGGLSAVDVVRRAIEVSPQVRSADAAARVASRRAGRAYSLFVPRVELSASYRRLSEVEVGSELQMVFPLIFDMYSTRAAVRVPVSDYFLTLSDHYDSAQHAERVADLQRRGQHQAIAFEARREYLQLARALTASELSAHRIAQLQRFVDEIGVLVAGGEVGSVHLSQARVRLSAARAAQAMDTADHRVAEATLRRRLGLPQGQPVGVAEPLTEQVPAAPADLPKLIEEARAQRPEAQALRALAVAHTHSRDAVAGGRYPKLSLVGDINMDNPNQRVMPLTDEFNTTWAVGVELFWSPSDLAARNDELDDANFALVQAQQDLRALDDRIANEVTRAYEDAHAAIATADTLATSVKAAEETLQVKTALFRSGEAPSRDVLDAELDLRTAQLQWVDARLASHLAHAALDHALGRALP